MADYGPATAPEGLTPPAASPAAQPLAEQRARRPWRVALFALAATLFITFAVVARYALPQGREAARAQDQQATLIFADTSARLSTVGLDGSELDPWGRRFAEQAAGYYLRVLDRRPRDLRLRVSAALMYDRLDKRSAAHALVAEGLRLNLREAGLIPLVLYYSETPPQPRWGLDPSLRELLQGMPGADIFWAGYYQRLGMTPLAEQVRARAAARAERLLYGFFRLVAGAILLTLTGLGLLVAGLAGWRWYGNRQVELPPWGMAVGLQALVVFAVASEMAAMPGLLLGGFDPTITVMIAYLGGVLLTVLWFALTMPAGTRWVRASGWRLARASGTSRLRALLLQLGRGLAGYAAALPALVVFGALGRWLFPNEPLLQPLVQLLREEQQTGGIIALALLLVVVAPIFEETLFRGILYGGLRRRLGVWPAAVASGLLFAVLHLQAVIILPLLALGVVLALLYERSGSLLPPMVTHAALNGMSFLAQLLLR